MTEPDFYTLADQTVARYVTQIQPHHWDLPTPDTDWSVRDLVRHLLEAVFWVPDVLAGRTIAEVGDKYDAALADPNPQALWPDASRNAQAAVRDLTDLNHTVHLSYGDHTARVYLQHQSVDLTIHAWDLARAVSADETLPPELVQAAWEHFQPLAEDWRTGGILGPAVPMPEDAPLQTKLLALSGRNVNH